VRLKRRYQSSLDSLGFVVTRVSVTPYPLKPASQATTIDMPKRRQATKPASKPGSPIPEINVTLSARKSETAPRRRSHVAVLSHWQLMLLGISITHQTPDPAAATDLQTVKTTIAKRRGQFSRPTPEQYPTSEHLFCSLQRQASGARTQRSIVTTSEAYAYDDSSDIHASSPPTAERS
jgi:hypothetical protein